MQLFHFTILIQFNDDKHCLNHVYLKQFICDLKKLIYIFSSEHNRIQRMNYSFMKTLTIFNDKRVSCSNLFYYTSDMKDVIQVNVNMKNDIINEIIKTIINVLMKEKNVLYLFS